MIDRPKTFSISLTLILINAAVWFIYAMVNITNQYALFPDQAILNAIISGLALLTAIALWGLTVFLKKKNKIAYFLTLAFLIFITLLTIADDFGIADLIVLILLLIPIVFLIKDRGWYFES